MFHTDAVQAVGHMPVDVKSLGVDMLSLPDTNFTGPREWALSTQGGGVRLAPLIDGGAQERKRRAGGTENMAGIVGIGMAIELAVSEMDEVSAKEERLRDKL